MRPSVPIKAAATIIALAVALLLPASALANLVQRGNLFVTFDGGISPTSLPRRALAPISVRIEGKIRVLAGDSSPALRRIEIKLNRTGRLDTRGLPVCSPAQVEATSTRIALGACGPALVGEGSYAAASSFPEQSPFPSSGHILAFNARSNGHPAILTHIFGTRPFSATRLVIFHLRHLAHGSYGTVLTSRLPASLNPKGYIKRISLRLHRTYTYRGARHSYLSASCAAPAGFSGAVFPFARASFGFADGRTLSSTLTRSCAVGK
jgi:hypothetical protein